MSEGELQVALAVITAIVAITNIIVGAIVVILTRQNQTAIKETHDLVNSRTTELVAAVQGQATAEGFTAGEEAQRIRETP